MLTRSCDKLKITFSSSSGFHVNSAVLQTIVSRYADAQYAIDFDSFVGCLIKLEMLFSKSQQTQQYHFSVSHIDLRAFSIYQYQ